MNQVRQRRTAFAFDLDFSERHRLWGFDAPMVDIDWLVIEYDKCEPVALIDYKAEGSPRIIPNDANAEALRRLGERALVPTFVVRYRLGPNGYEFFVIPMDDLARGMLPTERRLDEISFVTWIYRLRGRPLPAEVRDALRDNPVYGATA